MPPFRRAALSGAFLLALGVLAGLTGVPASAQVAKPAHAVRASAPLVNNHGCAAHTFCMWNMANWFGEKWSFNYNTHAHNTWLYVGNGANDEANSLDNNRAWPTDVDRNFPANAQQACVRGSVSNLFNYSWPDGIVGQYNISSIFFATAQQSCGTNW